MTEFFRSKIIQDSIAIEGSFPNVTPDKYTLPFGRNSKMNDNKLFYLTRSSGFLWKTSLSLTSLIMLIGIIVGSINTDRPKSYDDLFSTPEFSEEFEYLPPTVDTEKLATLIKDKLTGDDSFDEKLISLNFLLSLNPNPSLHLLPPPEQLPTISPQQYTVIEAFAEALNERTPAQSNSDETNLKALLALTKAATPTPYASYALALYYSEHEQTKLAIEATQDEIKHTSLPAACELLINLYSEAKVYTEIENLKADPLFAPYIDSLLLQDIALARLDWPQLFVTLLPAAYEGSRLSVVLLAVLTGLVWCALLLRINGSLSLKSPTVRLALPALLLGAIAPT